MLENMWGFFSTNDVPHKGENYIKLEFSKIFCVSNPVKMREDGIIADN